MILRPRKKSRLPRRGPRPDRQFASHKVVRPRPLRLVAKGGKTAGLVGIVRGAIGHRAENRAKARTAPRVVRKTRRVPKGNDAPKDAVDRKDRAALKVKAVLKAADAIVAVGEVEGSKKDNAKKDRAKKESATKALMRVAERAEATSEVERKAAKAAVEETVVAAKAAEEKLAGEKGAERTGDDVMVEGASDALAAMEPHAANAVHRAIAVANDAPRANNACPMTSSHCIIWKKNGKRHSATISTPKAKVEGKRASAPMVRKVIGRVAADAADVEEAVAVANEVRGVSHRTLRVSVRRSEALRPARAMTLFPMTSISGQKTMNHWRTPATSANR